MLTPDKIREKSFQTTGRGSYRAEDVDNFLDDVTVSYEQMFKENGDLIKKISILAKKVEEYRADEESLKLALLNAQKLADKIVADAKESATQELETAKTEAQKSRDDAAAAADELSSKAKRESEAIIESAKAEAEKIVAEANRQSNEILGNINRKVTHESLVFEMVQKEASEFKSKLVAMYKEHINLINQLPEIIDEQLDANDNAEVSEEDVVAETVVEEEAEIAADIYMDDAESVHVVIDDEEEIEDEAPAQEPETVDIYSSVEEDDDVVVLEDEPEVEVVSEEPVEEPKAKPFKLDFSKIDFADEENDTVEAPVIAAEPIAEDLSDDDDTSSISFKKFFRKK